MGRSEMGKMEKNGPLEPHCVLWLASPRVLERLDVQCSTFELEKACEVHG
jgi:hypothetical protein